MGSDLGRAGGSPAVELKGIEKRFITQVAVHPLDLKVAPGEFHNSAGPERVRQNGFLLRMIAGLEVPTAGRIMIFGEDVTNRPPNERPLNLVFQRPTLFQHLNVADNIAFGQSSGGEGREEVSQKQRDLLELVRPGRLWLSPGNRAFGRPSPGVPPWPVRSPTTRRCCCWTSLFRLWTWRFGGNCKAN